MNQWIILAAIIGLVAGAALSHLTEPGVGISKITLAGDTPAIRFGSSMPGKHPVALLAHGATASKETLFRYGEGLAANGFDCFAIDLPGHGESRRRFSFDEVARKPGKVAQEIGDVDVFIGHSMGAGAGAWGVREAAFRPKLFIALGANVRLGENGPPLLLLAGAFEEFHRPAQLRERTDARVIISPWCDHVLEPYDPHLVNAAVEAACGAVGKGPAVRLTAWLWRLLGLLVGAASAVSLVLYVPRIHSRLEQARGVLTPALILGVLMLTTGAWGNAVPHWNRMPLQILLMGLIWLALLGLGKVKMPRWTLIVLMGAVTAGSAIIRAQWLPSGILVATFGMSTILLGGAAVVGWLAARNGRASDGNLAMAIFAGYSIGQFLPCVL